VLGIHDFFVEIDRAWVTPNETLLSLHLIGSTALMLQTNYQRGTKDSDVLETAELTAQVQKQLLGLAGPGSTLRAKHRLYLEIVSGGLPFLPQQPQWHTVDLPLRHFRLQVLDVVDVVVSKVLRMNANDLSDIEAMIELGRVPHERLVERFRAAVDVFAYDARGADLPRFVQNLHRIERDMLGVEETEIELPSWI
jgi:hypothetical protein